LNAAKSLISHYISRNKVEKKDIIVTQSDGMILTRSLDITDDFLELDFRGFITLMIVTVDRNKFLYSHEKDVVVRGISHRYPKLDDVYKQFCKLNLYDKKRLFLQMRDIQEIVLSSDDKELFMIPAGDGHIVQTKAWGSIKLKTESVFDVEDIDRRKYYDHYFREFLESIFLEYY